MTLEEAILRNDNRLACNEGEIGRQDCEAIQLGIEALKRLRVIRNSWPKYTSDLLPGETEE